MMACQFENEENDDVRNSFGYSLFRGKKLMWNKIGKRTRMEEFMNIIQMKYGRTIDTYCDLHKWSVQNSGQFWEEVFKYFDMIYSEPYDQVLPDCTEIFGVDWFRGLKFNFAENVLRHRDDRVALICLDMKGREKVITHAEMYEEVKRYAAAWRKQGLQMGDVVACYMSNREEAIFSQLACASIGAVWGAISCCYGFKLTLTILREMKPKFLFATDRSADEVKEQSCLKIIENAVNDVPSVKKVIIVPTKDENVGVDISGIRNSCFLNEFLESADGDLNSGTSELTFEQLPFNYPVRISFTSGTTSVPKGIFHSSGTHLTLLACSGLYWNCSRDDVLLTLHPSGHGVWYVFHSMLSIGATSLLFDGNPLSLPHISFWDLMAKYKVTVLNIETTAIDMLEKLNNVPGSFCDLKKFRLINVLGSPVKFSNFEFCQKLKKGLFVGCGYGQTETFQLSGLHLNSPAYSGEIQCPGLGVDLKVYNASGNSVIGEIGDLVVCSPLPSFPLYLLNDKSGEKLRKNYLTKFPGVWSLSDRGIIDPETNGFVVVGRTDYILSPLDLKFCPSEIYLALQDMNEVLQTLCVRQDSSKGHHRAVLFLKLSPGVQFNDTLVQDVTRKIEQQLSFCHIPQVFLKIKDIPVNNRGKKLEMLVTEIINTNQIPEERGCRNPECLEFYRNIPELQGY